MLRDSEGVNGTKCEACFIAGACSSKAAYSCFLGAACDVEDLNFEKASDSNGRLDDVYVRTYRCSNNGPRDWNSHIGLYIKKADPDSPLSARVQPSPSRRPLGNAQSSRGVSPRCCQICIRMYNWKDEVNLHA